MTIKISKSLLKGNSHIHAQPCDYCGEDKKIFTFQINGEVKDICTECWNKMESK